LKISAVCQTKFGEPKFPISWQKNQQRKKEWRGLVVGCTLAGMSPVLFVYLKVGRSVLVYICKKEGE